jgi:hypothetical protein
LIRSRWGARTQHQFHVLPQISNQQQQSIEEIKSVSSVRDDQQITSGNLVRSFAVPIGILHHVEHLAAVARLHPIVEHFRFPDSAPASQYSDYLYRIGYKCIQRL